MQGVCTSIVPVFGRDHALKKGPGTLEGYSGESIFQKGNPLKNPQDCKP